MNQAVLTEMSTLIPKWKFVARRLEVSETDIERICEENQRDTREQCYQMLLKWKKQTHGDSFNYRVLGEALRLENNCQMYSNYVSLIKKAEGLSL